MKLHKIHDNNFKVYTGKLLQFVLLVLIKSFNNHKSMLSNNFREA